MGFTGNQHTGKILCDGCRRREYSTRKAWRDGWMILHEQAHGGGWIEVVLCPSCAAALQILRGSDNAGH